VTTGLRSPAGITSLSKGSSTSASSTTTSGAATALDDDDDDAGNDDGTGGDDDDDATGTVGVEISSSASSCRALDADVSSHGDISWS